MRRTLSPPGREAAPQEHIWRAAAELAQLCGMWPSRFQRMQARHRELRRCVSLLDVSFGSGGFVCGSNAGQQLRADHTILLQGFMKKRLASRILMLNSQGSFGVDDLAEQYLAHGRRALHPTCALVVTHGIGEPVEAAHGASDHLRHIRLLGTRKFSGWGGESVRLVVALLLFGAGAYDLLFFAAHFGIRVAQELRLEQRLQHSESVFV